MYLFCKRWIKAVLILPTFLLFLLYTAYPIVDLFISSFRSKTILEDLGFVGFSNYLNILKDEMFLRSLQNTLLMLSTEFILLLPIGFLLGMFLNSKFKGVDIIKTTTFIPYILSGVMIAILWQFILDPGYGLINTILNKVGLASFALEWIGGTHLSPFSYAVVDTWRGMGFYAVLFLTGIKMLPKDCFEAAVVDGASKFQKMVFITIPMLKETIKVCSILIIIGALNSFQTAFVLTNGQPNNEAHVLASYLYYVSWNQYDIGRGAVLSIILFFFVMVISVGILKFTNKRIEE